MEIMELATLLGQAVKNDARVAKMNEAKVAYEKDEALQGLMLEYNTQQTALAEEYKKGEIDKDLVKAIEGRLEAIVKDVTSNPNFLNFAQAQEEVSKIMQEINNEIEFQVTGVRPCSHDCHSCGSDCHHHHED